MVIVQDGHCLLMEAGHMAIRALIIKVISCDCGKGKEMDSEERGGRGGVGYGGVWSDIRGGGSGHVTSTGSDRRYDSI